MTLPTPNRAFRWSSESWGHALRCDPLTPLAQHAFTTKQLQLRGGPARQPAEWASALASVGAAVTQLVRVKQVHGRQVRVLQKRDVTPQALAALPDADAIVSDADGLVLSVQVADCVPILIADPHTGSAAAVHAGWRGTCSGVARAAVETMATTFGVVARDVMVAVGPSIGPCCYAVGRSVVEAFRSSGASADDTDRWFVERDDGSIHLDLWMANRDQLTRAGVRDENIHICGLCTQTHHEIFESYRVDGERAGRMAALIVVPGEP